jgi:hypothetical protein
MTLGASYKYTECVTGFEIRSRRVFYLGVQNMFWTPKLSQFNSGQLFTIEQLLADATLPKSWLQRHTAEVKSA